MMKNGHTVSGADESVDGGRHGGHFLAGLQNVPKELYESVEVDGGNWFHKLISVTLPMVSPTIFQLDHELYRKLPGIQPGLYYDQRRTE